MIKFAENPVVQVPLTQITISKANKRSFWDPVEVDSLNGSIGRLGQIYPVLLHRVRPGADRFELIVGSRRFKAAKKAERKTINSVILDDITEPDMVVLSLAENLHREDLTPFEQAKSILELVKTHGFSTREVAKRINKTTSFVTGRLKLLSVPDPIQDLLCKNRLTLNHVGILASLENPKDQIRYAKVVARQSLSHGDLITLIRDEAVKTGVKSGPRIGRPTAVQLFTPMRTALKVRRFSKFLIDKVRPQLFLEGDEVSNLKAALRDVRDTIENLLSRKAK